MVGGKIELAADAWLGLCSDVRFAEISPAVVTLAGVNACRATMVLVREAQNERVGADCVEWTQPAWPKRLSLPAGAGGVTHYW
jgi:hypothetical protein